MTVRDTTGIVLLCLNCCLCTGCSKSELPVKVVHGTVSVEDQQVKMGQIVFVPIDGTKGPTSVSDITGGSYRVETCGGVPLGTHRVEVVAKRNTGRKVPGDPEGNLVDEIITIGPAIYATEASPLTLKLTPSSDGEFNNSPVTQLAAGIRWESKARRTNHARFQACSRHDHR